MNEQISSPEGPPMPQAEVILESCTDEQLVLAVPGTDYRLHLVPTVPAAEIRPASGRRIRGAIRARALRMHPARGGGRFLEPVHGAPRIVAGILLALDGDASEALVDAVVPMRVRWPEGQDLTVLQPGCLVNFYVESGTSFTPE